MLTFSDFMHSSLDSVSKVAIDIFSYYPNKNYNKPLVNANLTMAKLLLSKILHRQRVNLD